MQRNPIATGAQQSPDHSVRHALGGYREYIPPPALGATCESVWVYRTPAALGCSAHRVLPDPACNIVLSYLRGPDGRVEDAVVRMSGPKTQPVLATFVSGRETVAIKVKLECARAVAGVTSAECCDIELDLRDVRPTLARALIGILEPSRTLGDVARGFVYILAAHLRPPRRGGPVTAGRALDDLRRTDGRLSIDHVASQLGTSPRNIRRVIGRDAGLSPKFYGRTLRFLHAMRLADVLQTTTNGAWARIAAESGFYDQSHLIRESRALVGFTPQALWEERHAEVVARDPDLVRGELARMVHMGAYGAA